MTSSIATLGKKRNDGKKDQDDLNEINIKGLFRELKGTERCLLLQAKNTGAWLIICGTMVPGTVLSATEFWDFLCAPSNSPPLNL